LARVEVDNFEALLRGKGWRLAFDERRQRALSATYHEDLDQVRHLNLPVAGMVSGKDGGAYTTGAIRIRDVRIFTRLPY
jgi:hypothetical protein